jgi:Peptidase A4 family
MPTGSFEAILRATRVSGALVGLVSVAVAAVTAALAGPAGAGERQYSIRAVGTTTSSNWGGYAAIGADSSSPLTFTSATGTWTQTTATCTAGAGESASAVWVGLGGYDLQSQTLEQIGTDADCSSSGKPSYYMWYELVPDPPVNVKLKINPGDTITASVNVTGTQIWLQLKNRTTGAVFNKRTTVANPDLSSAEWIVEAPSSCSSFCRPVPLANFGSLAFSKVATTANSHPGTLGDPTWSTVPIQLVPQTRRGGFFPGERGVLQTSSTAGTTTPAAAADGRSFSVAWTADATAPAPASG